MFALQIVHQLGARRFGLIGLLVAFKRLGYVLLLRRGIRTIGAPLFLRDQLLHQRIRVFTSQCALDCIDDELRLGHPPALGGKFQFFFNQGAHANRYSHGRLQKIPYYGITPT